MERSGPNASMIVNNHPQRHRGLRSAWKAKEGVMTDRPVLIVGAGPTGLVLALWLTRLGISVRIIDKTAEPGTTSRALAVQARTLEFYHQVGLTDAVIAGGVKIAHLNFWVKGATFPSNCNRNSYGSCKSRSLSGWAVRARSGSMSVSLLPPIGTWASWWPTNSSAVISTTGSTSFPSRCPRYVSAPMTSPCWCAISRRRTPSA